MKLNYSKILKFRNLLKFYHWECYKKSNAYSLHVMLDDKLEDIDSAIDEFVEGYLAIKNPDREFTSTESLELPPDLKLMAEVIIKEANSLDAYLNKLSSGNPILESLYQNIGGKLATLIYLIPQCV